MQKLLPLFLAFTAALGLGACSHNNDNKPKKSSAHIYDGDAPTIKFMDEPETAGGRVHTY